MMGRGCLRPTGWVQTGLVYPDSPLWPVNTGGGRRELGVKTVPPRPHPLSLLRNLFLALSEQMPIYKGFGAYREARLQDYSPSSYTHKSCQTRDLYRKSSRS